MRRVNFLACFGLLFMLTVHPLPALGAEDTFYAGKSIRLIVPYTPGGGFDILARIVARYLPKHIPGGPRVIVLNMPGGAGRIGPNFLYNRGMPDGLTIGMIHGTQLLAEVTKAPGINFRMERFSWIGSVDAGALVLGIRQGLPYRTVKDFRTLEKPLYFAATGPGTISYDYPMILKRYGGLNFEIVAGYQGSADTVASVQRGEAHGGAGSLPVILRNSETLRVVIGDIRARRTVPDIIDDKEIVTSPQGALLIDAVQAPQRIGRAFAAPPGVSGDRMQLLTQAWDRMTRDPAFLREVDKAVFAKPEDLVASQEIREAIAGVMAIPDETWRVLEETIQEKRK